MEKLVTRSIIVYHAVIGRPEKTGDEYKINETIELTSHKPITRAEIKEYTTANNLPNHRLIEKHTTIEKYAMPVEFFIEHAEKIIDNKEAN